MAHNDKRLEAPLPFSFCQKNTYKCCEIGMLTELLGNRLDTALSSCSEAHAFRVGVINLLGSLSKDDGNGSHDARKQ